MEDSNLSILLYKLNQKRVLPDGINPDVRSLMTLAKLLSETVDSDRFSAWCKFTCSVLNKFTNRCLTNGYTHAFLTNNPSMAQSCLNELMHVNSTLEDQSLSELIKASKRNNMNASNPSIIKKNEPLIRSQTCEESQKRSSDGISNADSIDCNSDNEPEEPRVSKRPALGNRLPAQVVERKKHNEEQLIKKAVNAQCLHEGSDESDELFKPSTSRTIVKSKEKLVNHKSAYSTKNSQISYDPGVFKQCRQKSRTLTHKLCSDTSESDSDEDTHKLNSRSNLNKNVTPKEKNRNQFFDSESDDFSDDDALPKNRESSGRNRKRHHKQLKDKNRVDSQDSESDDCLSSSKKREPGRPKRIKKTEPATKDKNLDARNRSSGRKKPASRRNSSVHSDSSILSPVPKPQSRSHSANAMLQNIRALQTESESSLSTKNKKDDIKSKPSKSKTAKPTKTANPKNKKEQKESSKPKGKPTNKQSPRGPLKQTSDKPEDSSKSTTKAIVKKSGKKLENKNEETLDKQDIECASSSKFVKRLQQLESSILKGTPDPLENNKPTKKKAPATQSQKNKSGAAKSKETVNSKIKPSSKNTKKSPTVKTQKKPANKKIPVKKAPAKKAPTKKSQKLTNTGEDKENIESQVSKDINELNNREKTDIAKDKSGAVPSNQVQTAKPDGVNISEREDKNDPESFFSSEEDSELDSEPELGTLSACMNSIKRKIPRQTGTATPPLKIFLSSMYDAQSDILESEGSSFSNVPLKLDDKNVVKRMAKANKPKETVKQDFSVKKLTKTPEALKKIMKLKSKCDAESSLECSSFSDDD